MKELIEAIKSNVDLQAERRASSVPEKCENTSEGCTEHLVHDAIGCLMDILRGAEKRNLLAPAGQQQQISRDADAASSLALPPTGHLISEHISAHGTES